MRTLWRDDVATFDGEFARFGSIRVNPEAGPRADPVVLGGNSDALRRAAGWGDGWYGFNLPNAEAVRERVGVLHTLSREAGRDPAALEIAVALTEVAPADIGALAEAGVTQLVVVEAPPAEPGDAREWTRGLADRRRVAARA
jgi:alkanesulfonate monooxygenase SsuD/methylene tetrahydromethanopterin reductase-like flavin-dependent oxidoreductase (luciferase family)